MTSVKNFKQAVIWSSAGTAGTIGLATGPTGYNTGSAGQDWTAKAGFSRTGLSMGKFPRYVNNSKVLTGWPTF